MAIMKLPARKGIHAAMQRYLEQNLFYACPIPWFGVERAVSGGVRHGLVCRIDLEEYDYHPGCRALIRATERTVLERIPPRVKVRRGAPLELPHTMILVDDGARPSVFAPDSAPGADGKTLWLFFDGGRRPHRWMAGRCGNYERSGRGFGFFAPGH